MKTITFLVALLLCGLTLACTAQPTPGIFQATLDGETLPFDTRDASVTRDGVDITIVGSGFADPQAGVSDDEYSLTVTLRFSEFETFSPGVFEYTGTTLFDDQSNSPAWTQTSGDGPALSEAHVRYDCFCAGCTGPQNLSIRLQLDSIQMGAMSGSVSVAFSGIVPRLDCTEREGNAEFSFVEGAA